MDTIIRRKPKYQVLVLILFLMFFFPKSVQAVVDPLSTPNNKYGIHIITASVDESSPAAQLVNNKGDWGYITFLIESKDRKKDKWQEFFNDLRRRHLIPIVRLATEPEGHFWKRPTESDAKEWAEFLDSLNWPVKNRYVIVYNEPNHGAEWGGSVDPRGYARVLDQTITQLKNKSEDFFIMNAGFDASPPSQPPSYETELKFITQMNEEIPGIFNKLDGWSSHSYPNPEFIGSPDASGRGTVRTYFWEMQQLRNLGLTKNLPIFITETGWRHSQGVNYNPNYPSPETIASYYTKAFNEAWNTPRIVAVTPFLLNYQTAPFDYFSFKKINPADQVLVPNKPQVLGAQYPEYHTHYFALLEQPKTSGRPIQINKAQLSKGEVYSSIVAGENYTISLTFKNTGQSIWGDGEQIELRPLLGGKELGIEKVSLPAGTKVEPNGEYTFNISFKAPEKGIFKVALNLFSADTQFESAATEFTTEVKLPVIIKVLNSLKWKDNPQGEYILRVSGVVGESSQRVTINKFESSASKRSFQASLINQGGMSEDIEARQLLPDYEFNFTLEKPYYHPKTIRQKVTTGENILDFGPLEPQLFSAILNPKKLWELLPFSN